MIALHSFGDTACRKSLMITMHPHVQQVHTLYRQLVYGRACISLCADLRCFGVQTKPHHFQLDL